MPDQDFQANRDLKAISNIKAMTFGVIQSIPAGKVCSYGRVAELAGIPGGAHLVGRMLRELPKGTRLPWHRVVLASGKLAFPENSPQHKKQRYLLEQEGVVFLHNKLDMRHFGS